MKRITFLLAVGFMMFNVVNLFAQTTEEIIQKHEAAMGGIEKWNNLKAVVTKSKFTIQGMDVTTTTSVLTGKAIKAEVEIMGNKIVSGYDGKVAWMIRPSMMGGTGKAEDMPAEQAEALKSQTNPGSPLMDAKIAGSKIELESKEKLDGADVYVLNVTDKAGKTTTIYLSASTFYVVKTSSKQQVNGQELDVEVMYSNYKSVDGLYFPFTMEQPNPMVGGNMVVDVTNIELNPKLDLSFFAKSDK